MKYYNKFNEKPSIKSQKIRHESDFCDIIFCE